MCRNIFFTSAFWIPIAIYLNNKLFSILLDSNIIKKFIDCYVELTIAWCAMLHMFPRFLAIRMYPPSPHPGPLNKHRNQENNFALDMKTKYLSNPKNFSQSSSRRIWGPFRNQLKAVRGCSSCSNLFCSKLRVYNDEMISRYK